MEINNIKKEGKIKLYKRTQEGEEKRTKKKKTKKTTSKLFLNKIK